MDHRRVLTRLTCLAAALLLPLCALGEESPRGEVRILISAAGDCTLGGEVKSGIDRRFARSADKHGLDWFLSNVRGIFASDDFTLVNLEGPLTTQTRYASKKYVMRGRPAYAAILSSSSVEVANLANNHTLDFGEQGYLDTQAALDGAGIGHCGGTAVFYGEKDGYTVGFLGFDQWNHTGSQAVAAVRAVREKCDLIVVSMHWGEEYHYVREGWQQKAGRALIDAGADLVIGTHPHVIQGIERYKGKYIVYSLGNFCFGGNTDPDDKDCYIFQQAFTLTENGAADAGVRVIPCSVSSSASVNDYRPTPLSGDRANRLMKKIAGYSSVQGGKWLPED
ncbi:MAG: CapA family protein [Clostridia bacterium]|nr:CapA family protein [Clostridia bacterium]